MSKLKDRMDGAGTQVSLCIYCKHYTPEQTPSCNAFPEGIPRKFITGYKDHMKIDPNQQGQEVFTAAEWVQVESLLPDVADRLKENPDA